MTSKDALLYAKQNPNLRQNVWKYVQSSDIALQWAILFPEDKDIMRGRVTDEWTYEWALTWPEDRDIVKKQIKDPFWIREFIRTIRPGPGLVL